ncbi:hypothetical protein UFOVP12_31 [uncultured Caudovirales phage]|uniref:Uncharacterized protein n=1 Tax=uncultured Caudovirales phage TaxID=2100421 RepID=A0A6J5KJ51_9CAUD|nr:hypothetical protein UFOVP12_31 [uncultured Caudovirales phage]
MKDKIVAEFAGRILHAVTLGHMLHLQTRSFAEHMALNDFYNGMGDLADSFIESYQGKYWIVEDYPDGFEPPAKGAVEEIRAFSDYIESTRHLKDFPQDSELQNAIDEIQSLINSTLYKLRFLT